MILKHYSVFRIICLLYFTTTFLTCTIPTERVEDTIITDYSGTYYVNLGGYPRWTMSINQSDNIITFTMSGEILLEGEGEVSGNAISLVSQIMNELVHMFITFSDDGQYFSGTFEIPSFPVNGTITGKKSPWSVYDIDANGILQFISTDVIELQKIGKISKFRSGYGHDYSDDFESCRSMKHYFIPREDVEKLSIEIFSPITGTIVGTIDEWTEDSVSKGTMISIKTDNYPFFYIIIFHIDLIEAFNVGDKVSAGQVLGTPPDYDNVTISDIAVGVNTPNGYKLVSYFDVMTDFLFQNYQSRDLNSRDDVIISKDERDANSLTCNGEEFVNGGNLENIITLNSNGVGRCETVLNER